MKGQGSDYKHHAKVATRNRLAREVARLERELLARLPTMYEDEINVYKAEIGQLRIALTKAERSLGGRKEKPASRQVEMFK